MKPPKGWHSRGYLPHFDGGSIPQTVTFRLADSLPKAILDRWENELATMPEARASLERRERIEHYLDSGAGQCWLARPAIAETVENALLFFEGQRYELEAWVVMPNDEMNPVAAGLCLRPEDWPYGSARFRRGSAGVQPAL